MMYTNEYVIIATPSYLFADMIMNETVKTEFLVKSFSTLAQRWL